MTENRKQGLQEESVQSPLEFTQLILRIVKDCTLLLLIGVSLFCAMAIIGYDAKDPGWSHVAYHPVVSNWTGLLGAYFADLSFSFVGVLAWIIPPMLLFPCYRLLRRKQISLLDSLPFVMLRFVGGLIFIFCSCALFSIHLSNLSLDYPFTTGGIIGQAFSEWLVSWFSIQGSSVVLWFCCLIGLTLFMELSWRDALAIIGGAILTVISAVMNLLNKIQRPEKANSEMLDHFTDRSEHADSASNDSLIKVKSRLKSEQLQDSSGDSNTASVDKLQDEVNLEADSIRVDEQGLERRLSTTFDFGLVERIRSKFSKKSKRVEPNTDDLGADIKVDEDLAKNLGLETQRSDNSHQSGAPVADKLVDQAQSQVLSKEGQSAKPAVGLTNTVPDAILSNEKELSEVSVKASTEADGVFSEPKVTMAADQKISTRENALSTVADSSAINHSIVENSNDEKAAFPEVQAEEAVVENSVATAAQVAEKPKLKIVPLSETHQSTLNQEQDFSLQKAVAKPASVALIPSVDLLDPPQEQTEIGYTPEQLEDMSRLLEIKLKDFGVVVEVVEVNPGPVITRFEIQPAPGVKSSKIVNLAKDLARSLAVLSVRVVEVIPGKSVMGIEIPNINRKMVRLSEVLTASVYQDAGSNLTLALGNDIAGNPVVANLAKMPHLLVAGTTGSGKSVGVNAMILSLLFKAGPQDVRLMLVDPKMLELSIYEGIPHLLTPVITDMKEAAGGLRWCVAEMERRYKLMSKMGVRNLDGFNDKIREAQKAGQPLYDPLWDPVEHGESPGTPAPRLETLPFIVVVIDEFADMMMIVGKKVEELIARIAQKARAAGIHLILATQRPSVDVITGLIKANVPTRIAFQVSSKIDSRTILDQGGGENLLGNGDMLFLPAGTSVPSRVHGAFVSDDEVHRTVEAWKLQGKPEFIEMQLSEDSASSGSGSLFEDDEQDAIYDEAVMFVTTNRKVSISSVQRKFKIGYNRAARIVESMEAAGVISTAGTNGQREVLAPPPPPRD